jgi:hypothetical protein
MVVLVVVVVEVRYSETGWFWKYTKQPLHLKETTAAGSTYR